MADSSSGQVGPVHTRLRDGTEIALRPIIPSDRDELAWGVAHLSATARYRRFFSPVSTLSDRQLRYFTELDFHDHFGWIAELADPGIEHPGLGVGRYVRLRDDPTCAEFAVVVLDAFQHLGLGRLLLGSVWLAAHHNGMTTAVGEVLRENAPMIRLLQGEGATFEVADPSEVRATIDLTTWIERAVGAPWDELRRVIVDVSPGR